MRKTFTFTVDIKRVLRIAAILGLLLGGPIIKTASVIYFAVDFLSKYSLKIEKKVVEETTTEEKK